MPSKNKSGKRAADPHPSNLALVTCKWCEGPVQSVQQYCSDLAGSPDLATVPVPMWFTLKDTCASCVAKPAWLTVTPENLVLEGLAEADITTKAVSRAMAACEIARMEELCKEIPERYPEPHVPAIMDKAMFMVTDQYSAVKGKNANKLLVLRIRVMLKRMDALLDKTPVQAKLVFQCVDGEVAYSLHLLSFRIALR